MYEVSGSQPPVLDWATLPSYGEGMTPRDILAHFGELLPGKTLVMHYGPQQDVVVRASVITEVEFPDDTSVVIHAEDEAGAVISRTIDERVTDIVPSIYDPHDMWFREDNGLSEIWWGITDNPVDPIYLSLAE